MQPLDVFPAGVDISHGRGTCKKLNYIIDSNTDSFTFQG